MTAGSTADPTADLHAEAITAARGWLAEDPDPETRAEVRALLERARDGGVGGAGSLAELADRFRGRWSSAPRACAGRWAPGRTA